MARPIGASHAQGVESPRVLAYLATTVKRTPDAATRSSMSSGSPVTIRARKRIATTTTHASTTSAVPAAAEQAARGMRHRFVERHDDASAQEPPELSLASRPTDLRQDRCGHQRHDPLLKEEPVLGPRAPVISVGRDEHRGS